MLVATRGLRVESTLLTVGVRAGLMIVCLVVTSEWTLFRSTESSRHQQVQRNHDINTRLVIGAELAEKRACKGERTWRALAAELAVTWQYSRC